MKLKRLIYLITFTGLFFSYHAFANDHEQGMQIALDEVKVNVHDQASIERGAKFFAQNCMVCHTMKYLEYNPIAKKAGITLDKMPLKQKEWWRNVVPPDLTLMARLKGPNWLYTYFHSFYQDSTRPTGQNNLIEKDVNMINVFVSYQGQQILVSKKELEKAAAHFATPHYYEVLKLVKAGSMTPEEFDNTMTDLVNFMVYAAEPAKVEREKIGKWVLLFLAILAAFAYFLKKDYWKNVK